MTRARPILFSGPLVRAILAGEKTETRRVIKQDVLRTAGPIEALSPYGVRGDHLYVREAFAVDTGGAPPTRGVPVGRPVYRADVGDDAPCTVEPRWRPSIHMPRHMARIWLRVEDVLVEQVQDIDEAGAVAEGVACRADFAALWDRINAPRGYAWGANPWVWVVRFKRVPAPECVLKGV